MTCLSARSVRSTAVLLVWLLSASPVLAHDLADGFRRARAIVGRHLKNVKLNSVYGTPAFDASGRRTGDIFLNFSGQGTQEKWMLMSLTLTTAGALTGEQEADNPREDRWGHHEKPGLELDQWLPPEEAVAMALKLHPGHEPTGGISLAYHVSAEHLGRFVMVLYWELRGEIRFAALDARYGKVLESGSTPSPRWKIPVLR